MKKRINIQNTSISYTLRKSWRARRMRLAVYCDGSVIVTTPYALHEGIAERFIREKTRWLFEKIAYFRQFSNDPITQHSHQQYLQYRDQALSLVERRIREYNAKLNLSFNSVRIKNQKTRWGSCSKKRNLNFNYKILFLPEKLQQYLVVHELCHLKEFSHSRKFWTLVEQTIPDYSEIRKQLNRQYTMTM